MSLEHVTLIISTITGIPGAILVILLYVLAILNRREARALHGDTFE